MNLDATHLTAFAPAVGLGLLSIALLIAARRLWRSRDDGGDEIQDMRARIASAAPEKALHVDGCPAPALGTRRDGASRRAAAPTFVGRDRPSSHPY